jgi:hypothetical protein
MEAERKADLVDSVALSTNFKPLDEEL